MTTAMWLGFAIGLRHAIDPDHVVAVSAMVARQGRPWHASWVGATWGLGHGATIFCFGLAVVAFRIAVPESLSQVAECGVGLLLVTLGASNLTSLAPPFAGARRPAPPSSVRAALTRSGLVGLMHGIAGSGIVTILAASALPTPAAALWYLGAFGIGTIVGMVACSTLLGAPVAVFGAAPSVRRVMTAVTGVASVALGAYLLIELALASGRIL